MRLDHLPVGVLEQVGATAVEDAGTAGPQRGSVASGLHSVTRRLHPHQLHPGAGEGIEDAHGVGAAADTGHHQIGQGPRHLLEALLADDPL